MSRSSCLRSLRRSSSAHLIGALILAIVALTSALDARAQSNSLASLQRCGDFKGMTIPASDIKLPTKGATIMSADHTPISQPRPDPDGEFGLPIPERCIVQGQINSIDPAAPPIKFNVNLPINWNGRVLQSGGGGMGGVVITAPDKKAAARFDPIPLDRPYPLTLGYVTFGSDGGHEGADVAFMKSDEALRNWAADSMKKTRDIVLVIVHAAYGRYPDRIYFAGESAGGREALMVAQKFPDDYDGIIATSPVLSWYYIHLADNNIRDKLIQGWLDKESVALIARKTRTSCDEADGLKDGVIARYLECPNDAAALRCPDGKQNEGCLSDAQIASINSIREPWSMAVPMAHGVTRYPGFGVTGDEDGERYQYTFYTVGTDQPSHPLEPGRGFERGSRRNPQFRSPPDPTHDRAGFHFRSLPVRSAALWQEDSVSVGALRRDRSRPFEIPRARRKGHHSPAVCGQCGRNADGRRILQQRRREARSTGHRRRAPLFRRPWRRA